MIDGYDTASVIGIHVVQLVVVAIVVARSVRFPSGRQLDRWLEGHGVAAGGSGRTLARAYLRRTRAIRSAGFVLGATLLPMAWMWYTRSAARQNDLPALPVLVGCFVVGVLLAELLRPRLSAGPLVASEPRTIAAYVPAFTRRDPAWMAGAFALLVTWSVLAAPTGTTAGLVIRASVAAAVFTAARAVQGWILSRPQSAAGAELLLVDDAIRATGATGLSALTYGVPLHLLGSGLVALAEGGVAGAARTWVALGGGLVTLMAFAISIGFLSLTNTWAVPRIRCRPGTAIGGVTGPGGVAT